MGGVVGRGAWSSRLLGFKSMWLQEGDYPVLNNNNKNTGNEETKFTDLKNL